MSLLLCSKAFEFLMREIFSGWEGGISLTSDKKEIKNIYKIKCASKVWDSRCGKFDEAVSIHNIK